jgi:hypothetical protein
VKVDDIPKDEIQRHVLLRVPEFVLLQLPRGVLLMMLITTEAVVEVHPGMQLLQVQEQYGEVQVPEFRKVHIPAPTAV